MRKREKVREALKSLLLMVLIASALTLTGRTWITDAGVTDSASLAWLRAAMEFTSLGGEPPLPLASAGEKAEFHPASWPVSACVTKSALHRGISRDTAAVGLLYDRAHDQLGVALGTAEDAVSLTRKGWETLLSLDGVFFEFPYAVPTRALAAWLRVDAAPALCANVASLALVDDGDALLLLIRSGEGALWRYKTAMAFDPALLSGTPAGAECRFAFEWPDRPPLLDADALLFGGTPQATLARTAPAEDLDGLSEAVLRKLGFSILTTPYLTGDGTQIYVDNTRAYTLSISPRGELVYRNPGGADPGRTQDEASPGERLPAENALYEARCIEQARALLDTISAWQGEARTPLSFAGWNGNRFFVRFSYELNGLPVDLPAACEAFFENGALVEGRLYVRALFSTDEPATLLPEERAAAVTAGGRFGLMYFREDGDLLTPDWASQP